jgi:hypothetical protein
LVIHPGRGWRVSLSGWLSWVLLFGMTRRCSECRARFLPAATAAGTQRVCGPECRKRRRARQARRRRRADPEGFRMDDWGRQKQCRQRRRATQAADWQPCRGSPQPPEGDCSGTGQETCHELASTRKCRNLQLEMLKIVDRSLRVSRASFAREQARIARELSRLAPSIPVGSGQAPGRVTRHFRAVSACNGE